MGGLVSCLACQAVSCACSGLCSCCGKVACSRKLGGRIWYTTIFFFFALLAWIFRSWGNDILKWIPEIQYCQEKECFGVLGVYRIGFALSTFHFIQAPIMIGVKSFSDFRVKIQDGFWPIKLLLLGALFVASFFIPNEFFGYFGWFALIASGIFILIQLILLVDLAHSWAENWISKMNFFDEERCNPWWWGLLSFSLLFYVIVIALVIVMFIFFCKDPDKCELNIFFIVFNIVFVLLISALAIHPKVQSMNPHSSILQSSMVSAYTTYLTWSALLSEPKDMDCNPFAYNSNANSFSLLLGSIFTILSVCYATFRAATSDFVGEDSHLIQEEEKTDNKEEESEKNAKEETSEDPDELGTVPYSLARFHLIFALGALYLSMLMSNWYTISPNGKDEITVDTGMGSVWVKIISSWLSIFLYIWTLVAPVLFPDRDWGFKTDV